MCFTPAVSLTTALIEWALAIVLLCAYRRSVLRPFGVVILALLGAYQFSEFMLCTTGQAELWGTIAFLSYTFLPAVGLHAALTYLRRRSLPLLIYGIPAVFALIALAKNPFVLQGTCETIFVTILTYFSRNPAWALYTAYYYSFILATFVLFARAYRTERGHRRKVCGAMLAAVLLMFIPTFILIGIFPALRIRIPSVLCHFALLTAAAFLIAVHVDKKRKA